MTINNGSVTAVAKGTQAFDKVYHANDLVFERYLPVGQNVYTGSPFYIFNRGSVPPEISGVSRLAPQNIKLNFSIDKLKTGLKINFNSQVVAVTWKDFSNGLHGETTAKLTTSPVSTNGTSFPVTNAQLQTGAELPVMRATSGDSIQYQVFAKFTGTTVDFYNKRLPSGDGTQETEIYNQNNTMEYYAVVDSITAY